MGGGNGTTEVSVLLPSIWLLCGIPGLPSGLSFASASVDDLTAQSILQAKLWWEFPYSELMDLDRGINWEVDLQGLTPISLLPVTL